MYGSWSVTCLALLCSRIGPLVLLFTCFNNIYSFILFQLEEDTENYTQYGAMVLGQHTDQVTLKLKKHIVPHKSLPQQQPETTVVSSTCELRIESVYSLNESVVTSKDKEMDYEVTEVEPDNKSIEMIEIEDDNETIVIPDDEPETIEIVDDPEPCPQNPSPKPIIYEEEEEESDEVDFFYESKYCDYCDKLFSDSDKFIEHLRTHLNSEGNMCMICFMGVTNRTLIAHMNKHKNKSSLKRNILNCKIRVMHTCQRCKQPVIVLNNKTLYVRPHCGRKMIRCDLCPKRFCEEKVFIRHMKTHGLQTTEVFDTQYECYICKQIFFNVNSLTSHMTIHNEETTGIFPDAPVEPPLDTKPEVDNLVTVFDIEEHYQCDFCPNTFTDHLQLNAHMLSSHANDSIDPLQVDLSRFKCNHCQEAFLDANTLIKHMMSQHTNRKLLPTDRKSIINRIIQTSAYKCTRCPKTYKKKEDLHKHVLQMHSNRPTTPRTTATPFGCSPCQKSFLNKVVLKAHMSQNHCIEVLVTNDGNCFSKQLQCTICKTIYPQRSQMANHFRIHTYEKTFTCHKCNIQCVNKRSLMLHVGMCR